jgi:hypothetical protein
LRDEKERLDQTISVYELIWQLQIKYSYLASLYPQRSVEREIYQDMSNHLARKFRVEGAAVVLQYRVNATRQRIADERWSLEHRQVWQRQVACCDQVLETIRRFGATVALLEHIQQQIKERLSHDR